MITSTTPARRRVLLLLPAAVLLSGLGVAAWLEMHRPEQIEIGGPFQLQDGNGRTVTDRDFRGKWMLVYFGYTRCPDACPTALQDMAEAVDLLGAKKESVALVFITIDPARDTPAVVKDYVASFDAPFTALSGTADEIARAANAYRVYYAKHGIGDDYSMDHSSIIYVMDPAGRFVTNFSHESSPKEIAATLGKLI